MGLMDWLFGGLFEPVLERDANGMRTTAAAQYQAFRERAQVGSLQMTGCRSEPAPTWQHTIRIGPPPETHKHRMARLIARRERSGR